MYFVDDRISFEDLFLKQGLYQPIKISQRKVIECGTALFLTNTIQFDCHCVYCNKETTFKLKDRVTNNRALVNFAPTVRGGDIDKAEFLNSFDVPLTFVFSCQRDIKHSYIFSFRIADFRITKVGQYPSVADIENHSILRYKKILNKDYHDFSKAIGLFSHGIGAGSFVYLRRIFENLIEEKHIEATKQDNWDETIYNQSRMDEKIKILKDLLPPFLVQNRSIYGILSKGIHELGEEECKGVASGKCGFTTVSTFSSRLPLN